MTLEVQLTDGLSSPMWANPSATARPKRPPQAPIRDGLVRHQPAELAGGDAQVLGRRDEVQHHRGHRRAGSPDFGLEGRDGLKE
jgi:hypothetical protein